MSDFNRREMLASVAAGAAALAIPREGLEAAAAHAHDAVAAEQQQQGRQYVPQQFTVDEYRLVRLLVDYVIPRDGRSGSASEAGVPQFMDFILGEYASNRTWMKDGLAWVNAECRRRFNAGFISCTDVQRREVLDAIAYPRRARAQDRPGVEFFTRFRNLTSSGFWTSRIGIADLGFIGNRPVAEWVGTPPNVVAWLERNR
ncbi:MAG: gluconate 2-dehydrogenase subunit 3 family protein [Gemmatimonadaceae bacterium]|nr:gluconate 2-dehydrogenase subunit 3 family protein [Gemmatimonadaceae bacterium]MCW5826599.1 gluconate 2-dehydrogenase subunit 3 family protein [Gemmatimonadaceae bacterium]